MGKIPQHKKNIEEEKISCGHENHQNELRSFQQSSSVDIFALLGGLCFNYNYRTY